MLLRQAPSAPDLPFLPGGDPLCPFRQRRRQGQIDQADGCRVIVTPANRDNVIVFGQFDLLDQHVDAEQACRERKLQLVFQAGEKSGDLFRFIVSVNRRLLD